jgi:hypothetical protein
VTCRFVIFLVLTAVGAYAVPMLGPAPSFAQPQSTSAADPKLRNLQALGEAYAKDLGLTFERVELTPVATPAPGVSLSKLLEDALAVGYSPEAGKFQSVPFATVRHIVKIKMGQGRTPEETVKRALSPGNVVVQAAWYFLGAAPVKSYTVFAPSGAPVFDTMMSLPALRGPVFSVGH